MAHLVLTESGEHGRQFDLTGDTTRIGRYEKNDIALNNGSVSGIHAEIVKTADGLELRDLNSTNGTRLNGNCVQAALLHRNDIIRLGDVTFMVEGDDVPPAPANDEGNTDISPIPRTTVAIRPLAPRDHRLLPPPPAFQSTHKLRHLWPVLIGLILLAVIVAFVVFVRRA